MYVKIFMIIIRGIMSMYDCYAVSARKFKKLKPCSTKKKTKKRKEINNKSK